MYLRLRMVRWGDTAEENEHCSAQRERARENTKSVELDCKLMKRRPEE